MRVSLQRLRSKTETARYADIRITLFLRVASHMTILLSEMQRSDDEISP